MTQVYAVFHLNLAFSSIEEDQHSAVITRCYTPLLDLIEHHQIPLGIELTGWTLNRIQEIGPAWVTRFKRLLIEERCELIGSGYSQIIGPLVPDNLNRHNQRLGLHHYKKLLDVTPALALVNEMAFSSNLVDVYTEAGYSGVVMDCDNVSLALGLGIDDHLPGYALDAQGNKLPLLWSGSILFQKLQRYAHGDIRLVDYLDYFNSIAESMAVPISLYCNDAEVFDYRPGRFSEESHIHLDGEWQRIAQLYETLINEHDVAFVLPSHALKEQGMVYRDAKCLTTALQPVPVKKQAKYNVSRWAVTGRDDLWINTICHRLFHYLQASAFKEDDRCWQTLCELWASDNRTHITERRWTRAKEQLMVLAAQLSMPLDYASPESVTIETSLFDDIVSAGFSVNYDPEGILLTVTNRYQSITLNLRRGLTVHSLSFSAHAFKPVIGTLAQGYFHSIELGADFYSGGAVIALIKEHRKVTDLEWVDPVFSLTDQGLVITAQVITGVGVITKKITVSHHEARVSLETGFPGWNRPYGTVRVNGLTLLPEAFEGALYIEQSAISSFDHFPIDRYVNHGQPASTLVSSTTAFSGKDGWLTLGDDCRRVDVRWDPTLCAAIPMLYHKACSPSALTRLFFSLCEVDETTRHGGVLPSFSLSLSPSTLST